MSLDQASSTGSPDKLIYSLSESEILALTIIGEARGEPIEGQVAVGCVIRNRLHNNPIKYKNYKDVCLEKYQFSCWLVDDVNYPYLLDLGHRMINGQIIDPNLRQCILVANGIKDWAIIDNTHGAEYYLTSKLFNSDKKPKWASRSVNVKDFGNQTFFNV